MFKHDEFSLIQGRINAILEERIKFVERQLEPNSTKDYPEIRDFAKKIKEEIIKRKEMLIVYTTFKPNTTEIQGYILLMNFDKNNSIIDIEKFNKLFQEDIFNREILAKYLIELGIIPTNENFITMQEHIIDENNKPVILTLLVSEFKVEPAPEKPAVEEPKSEDVPVKNEDKKDEPIEVECEVVDDPRKK